MTVEAYINFDGNCREAVEFYAKVFHSEKPQIMRYGDAPSNPDFPIPDDVKDRVIHTFLKIKGSTVMFSDVPPGMPLTEGNNISLVVGLQNKDEMKAIFNQLKDGGKVRMELGETFWSPYYGMLTDRFGIGWQLSYDRPGT